MNFGDFQEFKNESGTEPAPDITRAIFSRVHSEIHPSPWKVFSKLLLIHLVVGAFTLSLCPQFGVRLFGDGIGLIHYFNQLGDYGCMVSCGAVFMSLTALASAFVLNVEEFRTLKKSQNLQIGTLALLSLGFFVMLDAQILFGIALAWFCGTLIGGNCFLAVGGVLKRKILPSVV